MKDLTILPWMYIPGLDIYEVHALATVYSFSRDGESTFHGNRAYLADICLCSKRKVSDILDHLCEINIIEKLERTVNGTPAPEYRVNLNTLAALQVVNAQAVLAAQQAQAQAEPEPAPGELFEPAEKPVKRFVAPTPEQVEEYARSIDFELNGAQFVDYYTAKGWKVGNTPMKDWKACVRTWKQRRANEPARPSYPTQARPGLAEHNAEALAAALQYKPVKPF